MKRLFCLFAIPALLFGDALEQYQQDTRSTWETVPGEEPTETGLAKSMVGWGIGMAVFIAVVAAVVPQSK